MTIKVLNLISSPYAFGGAEKLLLDMDQFYNPAKFSIHYCNLFNAPQQNGLFSQALADYDLSNFNIEGHRWFTFPQIIYRLLKLIEKENFAIVHTHLVHATIAGGIIGKLGRKHRTVITQHYTQNTHNKFYLKMLDQSAMKQADRVIAISSAVKADSLAHGVREDRVRIILNGINLTEFDREAVKENHLLDNLKKEGKYIIGSVGNLHKRKDHFTLIGAIEKIIKTYANVHLVLVGEGTERGFLEKTLKEKNLEANVSLLGFQTNVPSLIDKFDLYAHSSIFEPFGIAILEAMAARKGVIATNVDGVLIKFKTLIVIEYFWVKV